MKQVTAADFAEALEDSRATVTPAMEEEYEKMRGELKKRAAETGNRHRLRAARAC